MISDLLDGLEIINKYDTSAPVVSNAYIITVPKVLKTDLSGPDQVAIEALGWVEHPVYHSYYFPAETITEVANVTGEGDGDLPPFPIPIPPVLP